MKKILIIRFSSIGDIVLTTPVMRCLKKKFPNAQIHFITKPQYKLLLDNNPYIDFVHVLDKPIIQKSVELKQIGFDYVVDLHHNLRSRIIKIIINRTAFTFNKLNFKKWLIVNFKINKLPQIHIVDRYLKTIAPLGVKNDGEGLDYFLPEHIDDSFDKSMLPENYIAFAIGAQHKTKKLPTPKIISICKLINQKIVLLGGKNDMQSAEMISRKMGTKVINLCGKLTLNQSAYVIKKSEKVITHDTGLMHIAAAFKKEIISVWGSTVPEFGMTPYYGKLGIRNSEFGVENLSCRPCSKIGFDKCPKGHFKCMMMQNEQAIAEFANSNQ